jgi:hypothetical protein
VIAAAAVVLIAVGVAGLRFLAPGRVTSNGGSLIGTEKVEAVRTELDLRKYAVLRREQGASQSEAVLLPSGVVDLTLLLPVGSEPGQYEIQVLDSELSSRTTVRATGDIRDFITTIHATLDLRSVPAGNYQLALRRDGDDWRMFPARVE